MPNPLLPGHDLPSLPGAEARLSHPNLWPVIGPISSSFGQREDPVLGTGEGEFHAGLDISGPTGHPHPRHGRRRRRLRRHGKRLRPHGAHRPRPRRADLLRPHERIRRHRWPIGRRADRSSATSATPAAPPATTSTTKSASTTRRSIRTNTCAARSPIWPGPLLPRQADRCSGSGYPPPESRHLNGA